MYTEGFVKLHRKSLETSVLKKPKVFTFFAYCLMRAMWEDSKIVKNGEEIEVPRGSFFTTEKQDLEALEVTRAVRDTCLKVLLNCRSINITTMTEGTMIKVNNFHQYQERKEDEKSDMEPTGNQQGMNMEPQGNEHGTKEENKERLENKRIYKGNSRNEGGRAHSGNKISPEAQKFMDAMKARAET